MHFVPTSMFLLGLGLLFSQAFADSAGNIASTPHGRWARDFDSFALNRRSDLPYPDLQKCQDTCANPGGDKSLFFTGVGRGGAVWTALAKYAVDKGLKFVTDVYTPSTFCDPDPNDSDNSPAYRTFCENFCQVFADKSSGTAYVGIPESCDPNPASVWSKVEYPGLIANKDVTKIIRFDPQQTGTLTTIYPKANAAASATDDAGNQARAVRSTCDADDYIVPPTAAPLATSTSTTASTTATVSPVAQANPQCSTSNTVNTDDAIAVKDSVAAHGNGANNDNCCVTGATCASLGTSGTAHAEMCGSETGKQCAGCQNLSTSLNDIIVDCTNDYEVAGSVAIPYLNGVKVNIVINDST